jgi:hypothetical protein
MEPTIPRNANETTPNDITGYILVIHFNRNKRRECAMVSYSYESALGLTNLTATRMTAVSRIILCVTGHAAHHISVLDEDVAHSNHRNRM